MTVSLTILTHCYHRQEYTKLYNSSMPSSDAKLSSLLLLQSALRILSANSPWIIYQIRSVTQSCLTLCDPMNRSTPGLPVQHQLPDLTQTHVHRVSDAIQPSHPLLSPSPPAPNASQHQSLFQWVNSSHEVAKVLVKTIKKLLDCLIVPKCVGFTKELYLWLHFVIYIQNAMF